MLNLTDLSRTLQACIDCKLSGNDEWFTKHSDKISEMCEELPSGSGFDSGTTFDLQKSTPNKLVFNTSFHHMDEWGGYDGWTSHTITAFPTFGGFHLKISGKDRNNIKEYIHSIFNDLFIV